MATNSIPANSAKERKIERNAEIVKLRVNHNMAWREIAKTISTKKDYWGSISREGARLIYIDLMTRIRNRKIVKLFQAGYELYAIHRLIAHNKNYQPISMKELKKLYALWARDNKTIY